MTCSEIVAAFIRRIVGLACITVALNSLNLQTLGAASRSDRPLAMFCDTHPNSDLPARKFRHRTTIRPTLEALDATNWRCMDGKVYVCAAGASGSGCQKMNPSRTPSDPIRATCQNNPGQEFVAIAVIGNSSSTWRCEGKMPTIIKSVPLDRRGFMKQTWFPLFDDNGKLNTGAEPAVDPR